LNANWNQSSTRFFTNEGENTLLRKFEGVFTHNPDNYVFYPTAKVDDDIELRKRAIMKLQAFHAALGEDSQIYSLEEQTGSFGLFDQDLEEERDEALALLLELRAFRQREPARFREIRNLPLRARCGRKDKTRAESTVAFIRNRHRDVNTLQGTQKKLRSSFPVLLDALVVILAKYPLGGLEDDEWPARPQASRADVRPEIVISQSFG
jgi:hypothetical protein